MTAPYNWLSRLSPCSFISFLLDLEAIFAPFARPISKFTAFLMYKIDENPSFSTQTAISVAASKTVLPLEMDFGANADTVEL
ncbi:hypothetical protein TNCV_1554431 [Trichonephila clavipes]|nr:hypothetical protein TNCV_1554431 [Trichonephila clavipes]